jgi:hypothetical protein
VKKNFIITESAIILDEHLVEINCVSHSFKQSHDSQQIFVQVVQHSSCLKFAETDSWIGIIFSKFALNEWELQLMLSYVRIVFNKFASISGGSAKKISVPLRRFLSGSIYLS